MDITNIITLTCDEMSQFLTEEQLKRLETSLYKHFRNLKVVEECRDIEVSALGGDVNIVKLFIATKRLAGRAETTLEQYNLEIWIARTTIGKGFKDITAADIKMYLAKMMENGLSATTLNNKRRYLNSFFTFLHEEGIITENPVARIDPIKEPKRQKKAYRVSDLEAVRAVCKHPRDRAMVEFMLSTGIRVSELTSLKVSDLDMERRRFRVVGKGNKQRTAFYDEVAEYHLLKYFEWRMEHEGISREELKERPLFAKQKVPYSALENNGIRAALKRIAKAAGVENVHPHRFRRTFASNALHRNMTIEKVKGIMGHTKIDTTLLYIDDQDDLEQSYRTYIA